MPLVNTPGTADVFLLSTTTTKPYVFQPWTPENAGHLRYSIRVANAGAVLTVPLPLQGLRPTDGPVLRVLLAFLRSQAFALFRVSPTAHATIKTILSALWAMWSDLHGIQPTVYAEFCQRLLSFMPRTEPRGGDMTDGMRDFIRWVEDTIGVEALRYRPIDEDEVSDAVQQLRRRRLPLHVEITVETENADDGEGTHQYGSVRLHDGVEGTDDLLR